jgi:predicted YcjX-like family ATPase
LANAGKTVFLTSLINHLKEHEPEQLPIAQGKAHIKRFTQHIPGKGKNQFNYDRYRDTLVTKGNWPEKTADSSHFICSFERSDWKYTKAEFELFDFPGERVADAAMVDIKDFSTWSKYVLERLESQTEYREHSSKFLELQQENSLNRDQLTGEYKLTLARLFMKFKPLITPSTFLLGERGDRASGKTPEEVACNRYCGIDSEEQFIPLSEKLQTLDPKLSDIYHRRYKEYRERIVLPVFDYLKDCHRLIVLVDITTLLMAGTSMFSDNKEILEQLIEALNPGENFIRKSLSVFSKAIPVWKPGGITRIAFVVSKADKVHPVDRDNALALLKQMIKKRSDETVGEKAIFTNCAAVVSTEEIKDEDHMLAGFPVVYKGEFLFPGGEMKKFRVSTVPDVWPMDWGPDEYSFPELYPVVPKRRDCAPRQFGMESILDFIMEEDFTE